jgi:hypothetical protein
MIVIRAINTSEGATPMLTSFTRRIDHEMYLDQGTREEMKDGLCYDLDRAEEEGLYETITFDPEKLFYVVLETEVAVNVGPYTPVIVALERNPRLLEGLDITYAYHYGSNPVPEALPA